MPPLRIGENELFYVEQGVAFTDTYGDINEPFYNSMESMYEKALKTIAEQGLLSQYRARCKKIVDRTADIGWGFHDGLSHSFEEVYDD